jgi:hypothetical protein
MKIAIATEMTKKNDKPITTTIQNIMATERGFYKTR